MSFAGSAPPLVLERRPSRRLAVFLLALHGAGLLALGLPLTLPLGSRLMLAVLIAFSAYCALRREAWLSSRGAVVCLGWSEAEHWWLETRAGERLFGTLREDSLVLPVLTVLRFDVRRGRVRSVVLPEDGAEPETLRRLRVRLRHEPFLGGQGAP